MDENVIAKHTFGNQKSINAQKSLLEENARLRAIMARGAAWFNASFPMPRHLCKRDWQARYALLKDIFYAMCQIMQKEGHQ